MVIDFHTHTFPDRIAAAAVSKLSTAGKIPAHTGGTADALLASMSRGGITYSVTLPVATNPMKLSSMNTAAIAALETPGLIPFGAMHPDAPDWEDQLHRLAEAGIKGIKLHPLYQDIAVNDLRCLRLMGKAAELGLITLLHAGDDIGYPGVVRCSPEMARQALNDLGGGNVVLAHMGGWKNWERVVDHIGPTGAYIDTSFSLGFVTPLTPDAYTPEECRLLTGAEFCAMVRALGSHRVLFGTDSPWEDQTQALEKLRALPLTEAELSAILGGNAAALLRLPC